MGPAPQDLRTELTVRLQPDDDLRHARGCPDSRRRGHGPGAAASVTETIRSVATEGVATRSDLSELRGDLVGLRGELGAMEARLTWRMVLIAGAVTAFVTALDRLFA